MTKKFLTIPILAASLAIPVAAQSAGGLLQKGIYAQETAGDLNGAIQIYRQILNSPSVPRDIAVQAQIRVTQSLIKKGDRTAAASEAEKLQRDFPESRDPNTVLGQQTRLLAQAIPPPQPPPPASAAATNNLATLKDGRYHHIKSGTEFVIPPGWDVQGTFPSSDDGEQLVMNDSVLKTLGQVWIKKETNTPAQVQFWLQNSVGMKMQQRHDSGAEGYWVRADSVQQKRIGGKDAVTAVGDYVERGQKMVEYMIWIYTENTRAYFFARSAAADLPVLQSRFDQIVNTAVVP